MGEEGLASEAVTLMSGSGFSKGPRRLLTPSPGSQVTLLFGFLKRHYSGGTTTKQTLSLQCNSP